MNAKGYACKVLLIDTCVNNNSQSIELMQTSVGLEDIPKQTYSLLPGDEGSFMGQKKNKKKFLLSFQKLGLGVNWDKWKKCGVMSRLY